MTTKYSLDPDVKALLEAIAIAGQPSYHTLAPEDARRLYRQTRKPLQPNPPEVAHVEDMTAPGLHGPIGLRLYRPLGPAATDKLPVLIYFHGGGWTIGDLDTHDSLCRTLGNEAQCAVVSVDYRMGPEYKFPAAVDDCVTATAWVAEHAASLQLDAQRIAVGGDSAGANLATVVAITARDTGGPQLVFQLLIYPATNQLMDSDSHRDLAEGYVLTRQVMQYFRDCYLRGPQDYTDWRCSPLLAADLSRLPPALIMTAGFDPLRDEGQAYADKLKAAGVEVNDHCYAGMIHGFITMGKVLGVANQATKAAAMALVQVFKRQPV